MLTASVANVVAILWETDSLDFFESDVRRGREISMNKVKVEIQSWQQTEGICLFQDIILLNFEQEY